MTVKQLLTAEELWEMPEIPGKRFELVDGELVEAPAAGLLHNLIVGLAYERLRPFVQERGLGLVFTNGTGCVIRRQPDRMLIPDVSYLSWDQMPGRRAPEGYSYVSPDLAMEVVSSNDRVAAVLDNVREYLETGTRMVLVLCPNSRTITVYEPGVPMRELGPDDELDCGEVLPGFRVRVADLFDVQMEG